VRVGYRPATLIGGVCLLLGGLLLAIVDQDTPRALIIVLLVLVGLGLGFTSSAFVIAIQNAVPWSQRGVATATSQFFRTIGGSIGVAALGAVLAAEWTARSASAGVPDIDRSALLDPERRAGIPAETLTAVQDALAGALHSVFLLVTGLTVLVFLAVLFFPKGRAEDLAAESGGQLRPEPAQRAGSESGVASREAKPSEVT
jgi:MFS family permease